MHLKNGQEVIVREASKQDAKQIIAFYNVVGGESDFLSFGKNEFIKNLIDYEEYLETTKGQDNSIILLTEIDDKIMGIASINSSTKSRYKHVGEFGIVIAQDYCHLGLGNQILDYLITWSKSNGITTKISLVTSQDNYNALELYKKVGFQIEGTLKKQNYVNEVYSDTLMMGLIF
jgi:L-amino acid N-acyltransferase YncA